MPDSPGGYLSSRLQGFGTTIFTQMSSLAIEHDAVNLGQGFPDFDPPVALIEAAQQAMVDGHNQYAPGRGIPALRAAIAAHDRRNYGLSYDPATEVIVATGATEAMFATVQALVEAGDEVVVFEPVYDVYPAAVAMAGASVVGVRLRAQEVDGDLLWRFNPDDLHNAVTDRTVAIVVNSPHNPTGTVFASDQLAAIAKIAVDRDLLVITDEVYEHLVFDGLGHTPIATLPGMRDRTVRISSAGKTFSVTGWKVGWACAPSPIAHAIESAKQWVTFTSGTPFQHAIAEGLSWGSDYTTPMADAYQRRRDHLVAGLQEVGLSLSKTRSTYFVTADVRSLGFEDDVDFCRRLPAEVGVAAIPCSVFHERPAEGRGWVRFAFCKSDALLAEGLDRLQRGLPGMSRGVPAVV